MMWKKIEAQNEKALRTAEECGGVERVEGGAAECAENNDNGPKTLMEWLAGAQEIANALRQDR